MAAAALKGAPAAMFYVRNTVWQQVFVQLCASWLPCLNLKIRETL